MTDSLGAGYELLELLLLHVVPDVPEKLVDLGGREAKAGGNSLNTIAVEFWRNLPFPLKLVVELSIALVSLDDESAFLLGVFLGLFGGLVPVLGNKLRSDGHGK